MMNKVVLVGRLADDPQLRYTPNGTGVCNFPLAVERPFTNQQGERDVDYIDIVVWRKQAENCANYIAKGSLVAIDGRLQVRSYETDEGNTRWVAEVVANNVRFLDYNENAPSNSEDQQDQQEPQSQDDIDVPF